MCLTISGNNVAARASGNPNEAHEADFFERLRSDFNLPDSEEGLAICLAITYFLNHGFVEGEALAEKYKEFCCEWCGRLHPSTECNRTC